MKYFAEATPLAIYAMMGFHQITISHVVSEEIELSK